MKLNTRVFSRLESVGKPKLTLDLEDKPISETILEIAKWLKSSYMGSHMRITIARSQIDLESIFANGKSPADQDMMAELESMLQQDSLDLEMDDEPDMLESGDGE